MSSSAVSTAQILAAVVLTLGIGAAVATESASVATPVSATSHRVLAADEGPNRASATLVPEAATR
jgi:hypothetical protein